MLTASVIIITYNRRKDLEECLNSLFNMSVEPYEVIVVDSSSTDGTEKAKDLYPINFISIEERGITKARNKGISVAQGDVVAFVDDDVIVSRDWLKYLLKAYNGGRAHGVGGRVMPHGTSKEYYIETKKIIVGKVFDDGLVISNFDAALPSSIEVDFIYGCNMSFKKEALLRVGGFDENLKGNCFREDTDVCLRLKKLRYKIVYQPKALVWHKCKNKILDCESVYWYTRNHTYFYLKNIFPENKAKFPLFFYRLFFPPRDYIKRLGFQIELSPRFSVCALTGLIDGIKGGNFTRGNNPLRFLPPRVSINK